MSTESTSSFTARDFTMLAKAMNCTKEPFAIDYSKFAEIAGFKNANSAKASWHGLKKKIEKVGAEGAQVTPSLSIDDKSSDATSAAAGGAKKRKAKDSGEGESPVKKGRKPKAVKNAKAAADEDDDEEEVAVKDEEEPAAAKKGRKPAAKKGKAKSESEEVKKESDEKESTEDEA